jgi:TPR repeat protein
MWRRIVAAAMVVVIKLLVLSDPSAAAGVDETYEKPAAPIADSVVRFFQQSGFGKSYAVVIGVGDYDKLPKLQAPPNDALRVRDFLRDQAGFDYIVTLTDEKATAERIGRLMERELPKRLGPDDRFLFYFSGHGVTRALPDDRRGYLVLKDAGGFDEWDRMIGMPRLSEWAQNVSKARHTLFVLDACSSGLAAGQPKGDRTRDQTIKRLSQPGHHLITAGVDQEESYAYRGESLFTSAFLKAAGGQIDPPVDGIISLDVIIERIGRQIDEYRAKLHDNIKMTPHLYTDHLANNAGEFFFYAPPRPNPSVSEGVGVVSPGEIVSNGGTIDAADLFNQGWAAEQRKDDREAVRLYRLAEDQGNVDACVNLGGMYARGLGGLVQDDREAVRLYRLAADQGNALGQANLGFMYAQGRGGLAQEYREAVRLYRLAADQGNAHGQSNLGFMYSQGRGGLTKDDREAVRLYGLAAEQGDAPGQSNLGFMYARGLGGLAQDDREAVHLYRLAADQGNAPAQSNLGGMYARGLGGLAQDDSEAVRLYGLAADQGNALAQANLGFMYAQGRGGLTKDDREAVRLYGLAAEQGDALGLAHLGDAYRDGQGGLRPDNDEAARLYHLAAGQGNTYAQSALNGLK